MSLIVHPVVLPKALACLPNGQLPTSALTPIGPAGRLESSCAARAWVALWIAAKAAGHALTWSYGGTYRPLADQVSLFHERRTTNPAEAAKPLNVKFYNGAAWYLRPGVADAATPGTSKHGLGLAVDVASGDSPATGVDIAGAAWTWLLANADRFGWSWESQPEPWHIRYYRGDDIPQAVTDSEAWIAAAGATS